MSAATAGAPTRPPRSIEDRVGSLDWDGVRAGLDDVGIASTGPVLSAAECRTIVGLYDEEDRFRATVDMARHRFGEGQYRYFAHPFRTSSPDYVRRSGRTSCALLASGPNAATGRRRGRTISTNG